MTPQETKQWCSHCTRFHEPKQMERTGLCKQCAAINGVMARALARKLDRQTGRLSRG